MSDTSRRMGLRSLPTLPPPAAAFVTQQRIAYLATADASGRPHVVPICFAVAGGTLYTIIDRKPKRVPPERLRRVRNLLQNPRVAIVVSAYTEDWSQLGYVLLEGTTRVLATGPERAVGLELLRKKYPQYRTMPLQDRPMIVVTITRATHWGKL